MLCSTLQAPKRMCAKMLTGLALILELAFAPTYVTAAVLGGLGMFECLITVVEMLLIDCNEFDQCFEKLKLCHKV